MPRTPNPDLALRRRRQILDAAMACFRRRGFHQASMQEICAEARLSAGAVYRYFPSKTEIIAAIAEEERSSLRDLFDQISREEDPIEALIRITEEFINQINCHQDAPLFAEVVAEAARDKELAARLREMRRPTPELLASLIGRAQGQGRVGPEIEAERAARLIISALDGLAMRACLFPLDAEEVRGDVRELIERLLRSRRSAAFISQPQHKPAAVAAPSAQKETA